MHGYSRILVIRPHRTSSRMHVSIASMLLAVGLFPISMLCPTATLSSLIFWSLGKILGRFGCTLVGLLRIFAFLEYLF